MPVRFTSARFVGREGAFARLAAALDAVTEGRARTILLEGSGGLGVSRFLDEASGRIAGLPEPFVVLRGRAWPAGSDRPYAPLIRAIEPALLALDDAELEAVLATGSEDVVRVMPRLRERLAGLDILPARSTTAAPERRQDRVLEGLLGALGRMGERRPIALVVEDLHHADAATREFVTFLGRTAKERRLCLVGTWQPDQLTRSHPLGANLTRIAEGPQQADRIIIGPLDRDELAALVEGIEGERPSAGALVVVTERSGGSPLIAEELVAARRELSSASLTGTFEDLVVARLARRSPECRRLLRLLAPAGRPLSRTRLMAVADAFEALEGAGTRRPPRSTTAPRKAGDLLDADLSAGLEEAIEHGFVVELGEQVDFRHELLGQAVDADLLPIQRPRHHAALAAAFTRSPVAAAHHWLAAHEPSRARERAIESADRAASVDAPQDELRHLELALSLSGAGGSGGRSTTPADADGIHAERATRGETSSLLARAAEAAFAAGRPARAVAFAESAITRLDARRDRVRLALLHDRLGRYRRAAGDPDAAVAAHRRAVELVPHSVSIERATVLASLAQILMLEGMFSEAQQHAREAMRIARELGEAGSTLALHATTTLGVSLGWGDDPETGVALLRDALPAAEALGDLDELFRVYANLTTVLDLLGRRSEAVTVAAAGIEAARRADLEAVYGNFLRGNAAESLFLLGRWTESRALSATALEWSSAGVAFVNSIVNLAIVEVETRAGELAGRLLGQLLLELETVRDSQHGVPVYRASASFALWRGDQVDARRAAERGWSLLDHTEDWVLAAKMAATSTEVEAAAAAEAVARRDLAALAAARERCAGVLREAEAVVERSGVSTAVGSRREADAYLATARAHAGRVHGRDDPAAWARLAGGWRDLGNPYETARARWRQAAAMLASGGGRAGRHDAREPLLDATRIALELAARPLLRELRDLAGRALIPLPPAVEATLGEPAGVIGAVEQADGGNGSRSGRPASPVVRGLVGSATVARVNTFGLSGREREVLALVSEGRTNREIGERLFISEKTVGVHVGRILDKLDVSGRVEAATVAIRLGLTGRPGGR